MNWIIRSAGEHDTEDGVTVMFAVTVNVFAVVAFPADDVRWC